MQEAQRAATLTAFFAAALGPTAIDFALPNGREALATAQELLEGFLPQPGSRALARRYCPACARDNWGALRAFWRFDPRQWAVFTGLRATAREALAAGERITYCAVDPPWDRDRGAVLLALTQSRLLVAETDKPLARIPLERIATVTLQHAPVGSWLGVTLPDGGAVSERRFHCYAFTYVSFVALFTLLRQAIDTPVPRWHLTNEGKATDG